MNIEQKFRLYDRILAVIIGLIILSAFFCSCSTSRHSNYQDHLRSTPTDNWVRKDNGGCGWSN
jgi:hypothetical protein